MMKYDIMDSCHLSNLLTTLYTGLVLSD